ncbi:ATPase AAA [Paractinoplanes durhamensis]|uniref:ATPase AAA n=1 Tax=Paractinoplanes durhamensis TaxID=113563 RepID=A0ABQ3Z788_9ACTN|nr:ATP-binding protein [Actinoplanes durhamensis]GIE05671.1 ATPase AAA [Actinoplanes durhamensis]
MSAIHPYPSDVAFLTDELRRLNLLIRERLSGFPPEGERTQFARNVYVTREEVEDALGAPPHRTPFSGEADAVAAEIAARTEASARHGIVLGLPTLTRLFGLDEFERTVLVICLAPELRRDYDRIYAYLQDDLTRRLPSIDLCLDLQCDSEAERWHRRATFEDTAALRRAGLVEIVDDNQNPSGSSGLARFLRLDPRIRALLVGDSTIDPRLVGVARPLIVPAAGEEDDAGLERLVRRRLGDPAETRALVVGLAGPGGVESAAAVCARAGVPVLVLDAGAEPAAELVRLAARDCLLQQAALVVRDADRLGEATLRALAAGIADFGWLVVLVTAEPWVRAETFAGAVVVALRVHPPTGDRAVEAWRERLGPALARPLAARYAISRERIAMAADTAAALAAARGAGRPEIADVVEACRTQTRGRLGLLATEIEPERSWSDLILPADLVDQLRELCDQVRLAGLVHDGWGFGRRSGLTALFSGSPGTGKTLAAEVVAGAVGLDLFAVDLSAVVSKYIGETEKNLARVFDEAAASNAVLFFDEADALFGKRTEVSDAHDRYANIETGYLLQRIERHTGVVLLATNLRQNLDDAFTRRLRFLVEFPFPEEADRRRIWRAHLPGRAPIGDDVDIAQLARAFPLAGGNIRNVVLSAAFLAAADGGVIRQPHLLHGTRREFDKVGKVWTGGGQ